MADTSVLIAIESLRYSIAEQTIIDLPAWQLKQAQHCLILGPSGSGKTTLLHLLAGIRTPSAGKVLIAGQSLYDLKGSALDAFRARHIGIVFQTLYLLPNLSVKNNLRLAQYLAGMTQDAARVHATLNALNIAAKAEQRPEALSQGEAQRVAIARAVINHPTIILADEPTAALDDAHAEQVLQLLLKQAEQHDATLLVATHDHRIKAHFQQQLNLH